MEDLNEKLSAGEKEVMEYVEKRYHKLLTLKRKERKRAFDITNYRVKKAVKTIIKI